MLGATFAGRRDSFLVKTGVHYPTDFDLLRTEFHACS